MLLHNYSQDNLTTKPAERIFLRVLTQTLIIFIYFLKFYYFYNLENRA